MSDQFHETNWRRVISPIFRRVIAEHPGVPESEMREHLQRACPIGHGKDYRLTGWRNEINRQLGLRPKRKPATRRKPADPRQDGLF